MFTTEDKNPREVAEIAADFARLLGHHVIRRLAGPGMVLVECTDCHMVGVITAERRHGEGEAWCVQDAQLFRIDSGDRCDPRRCDDPPF